MTSLTTGKAELMTETKRRNYTSMPKSRLSSISGLPNPGSLRNEIGLLRRIMFSTRWPCKETFLMKLLLRSIVFIICLCFNNGIEDRFCDDKSR